MNFEIVDIIQESETIAVGRGIRILHVLRKGLAKVESEKALHKFDCGMVRYGLPRFIGLRRTG